MRTSNPVLNIMLFLVMRMYSNSVGLCQSNYQYLAFDVCFYE